MKAISIEKPNEIVVKQVSLPTVNSNEALVRIKSVMICGSDVSAYKGRGVQIDYPRIIGHEVAGVIEQVGENDGGLKNGDHVLLNPYIYCGECYSCKQGRTNACEQLEVLGVQTDGAMSEYFAHPTKLLIKVSNEIPWELVPLAEPLTIAMHALHRTKLTAGEHVVIIGVGSIGLYAAQIALAYGAVPIVLDVVDSRLENAKKYGVKCVINNKKQDSIAMIREITDGRMAEVVVEASGVKSEIRRTVDYASYLGRIAFTGWPTGETPILTPMITKKELDIRGSRTGVKEELEESILLMQSGKVDVKSVLSEVVAFDELPDAVRRIASNPTDYLKIGSVF
ncbi:putative zinc-type alcohol dehydrogenase-like protein [Clostridia bacterium]|nr:putative zinc-type alcohol dehydrogenase-like protein [Clostridia bacterium]